MSIKVKVLDIFDLEFDEYSNRYNIPVRLRFIDKKNNSSKVIVEEDDYYLGFIYREDVFDELVDENKSKIEKMKFVEGVLNELIGNRLNETILNKVGFILDLVDKDYIEDVLKEQPIGDPEYFGVNSFEELKDKLLENKEYHYEKNKVDVYLFDGKNGEGFLYDLDREFVLVMMGYRV